MSTGSAVGAAVVAVLIMVWAPPPVAPSSTHRTAARKVFMRWEARHCGRRGRPGAAGVAVSGADEGQDLAEHVGGLAQHRVLGVDDLQLVVGRISDVGSQAGLIAPVGALVAELGVDDRGLLRPPARLLVGGLGRADLLDAGIEVGAADTVVEGVSVGLGREGPAAFGVDEGILEGIEERAVLLVERLQRGLPLSCVVRGPDRVTPLHSLLVGFTELRPEARALGPVAPDPGHDLAVQNNIAKAKASDRDHQGIRPGWLR
jgi:hypothetical protein